MISELVDLKDQKYRASLTINSVTEKDTKESYHLSLTNAVGSVSYEFKLTTSGASVAIPNYLTMFILIAVGCIFMLISILVPVYKKYRKDKNETSPLVN